MLVDTELKNRVFTLEHRVYFNETNAVGGVTYFSNYVKWQGMAREEWFVRVVANWREIMKLTAMGELNMITVEEHSHFIQHALFGDEITIQLQMTNIRKFSFDMIFFMFENESKRLLYEGMQRLAFDDFNGKFVPVPPTMLEGVKLYEADLATLSLSGKMKKYLAA